jgi:DSF synthase
MLRTNAHTEVIQPAHDREISVRHSAELANRGRQPSAFQMSERPSQLHVRHDRETGILWYFMNPSPRPCFTHRLLRDIANLQEDIRIAFRKHPEGREDLRFLIAGSRIRGAFNLGGDLKLFVSLIKEKNRAQLTEYATRCIDVLYPNAVNLHLPITTISLVQGNALGGGFEAAVSSNVLIAERGVQMGLPEVLFNLFPGMGAYSFLARRLDAARAERMILSGRTYTAEALYDMGVVDRLAEPGQGEATARDYVKRQQRIGNAARAIQKVRQRVKPICYEELRDIAMMWVDAALHLEDKDLRVMERLVRAQGRLAATAFARAA